MRRHLAKNKIGLIFLLSALLMLLTACANTVEDVPAPTLQEVETQQEDAESPQEQAQEQEGNTAIEIVFDENDIVDIGDRFFATQVNDIILNNFDRYLGRPIRYEGLFWAAYWEWTGSYYYHVIRHTYGCCGPYESSVGFELYLGGIAPVADETWVEVLGILERSNGQGISHVRLRVVSLTVLDTIGMTFVPN